MLTAPTEDLKGFTAGPPVPGDPIPSGYPWHLYTFMGVQKLMKVHRHTHF